MGGVSRNHLFFVYSENFWHRGASKTVELIFSCKSHWLTSPFTASHFEIKLMSFKSRGVKMYNNLKGLFLLPPDVH